MEVERRNSTEKVNQSGREDEEDDHEVALTWASLQKLSTSNRLRTSIMKSYVSQDDNTIKVLHKEVDVRKLNVDERIQFIDRLFKVAEEDNKRFLIKFRDRIDGAGIRLPTVEVRFKDLKVEADVYVGTRALPTIPNVARNIAESILDTIGIRMTEKMKLNILNNISGILKPSRMALLLGPPSSGKTTLLLALAGRLNQTLKVNGEVTYNGHNLNEFVPEKTSAYISQYDVHVGAMTVKETLDFAARCQGVGPRYELLCELARREKDAGVYPDPEVDLFMKAIGVEGVENSLIVDYTLRVSLLFSSVLTLYESRIKMKFSYFNTEHHLVNIRSPNRDIYDDMD
ncbi:transcription factor [Dionaea muscipula]